ncbi:MAG TPA: trypco2 family protein [Candidatus Andersenbacteria bacterium]|nr:trypco2 family protein [Candidatus Andersenbacteria bacterium]
MQDKIPLADLLAHISDELFAADAAARKRGKSAMQFKECELEFAVTAEVKANAGIKVWVINVGAGEKNSNTNKIKIKFDRNPQNVIQAAHKAAGNSGPALSRQRQSK